MKYIVKYENFNESKGISDSSEKITNMIWDSIELDIIKMNESSYKFTFTEKDLKIKDIIIDTVFIKDVDNLCNASTYLKDSIIKNEYIENVKILITINHYTIDESFLYYIKSVIFHEILHVYQHYNLKSKNKFRPESFSIGSIIPQLRKNIKTKYVNYILDIIYFSLSHEISAQLHQYYMYKMDNREYKKLIDIRKLLSNFKIKDLDEDEETELNYIKNHILNSINLYTTNKKYEKDILNSIWNKEDNVDFLNGLSKIIKYKLNWMNKKIKLINGKLGIDYSETFTYYGELEDYKYISSFIFIRENLNDCKMINNI